MPRRKLFHYYQPNKKDSKDNHDDCVIRGISRVNNLVWTDALSALVTYSLKLWNMPSSREVYGAYLKDHEFEYHGISNKKGTKRPTVWSFTKDHPQGRYLLNVANHVVAVVDGEYWDTWDSGEKCLYGYYEYTGNKIVG